MGLFDWFRGKKAEKPPEAEPGPQPKLPPGVLSITEIAGSPMLAVALSDGTLMVVDRDTFDYKYGASKLPDPVQRDLDERLPGVTRVRALSGGMLRGEAYPSHVLLDLTFSRTGLHDRQPLG